MAFVLTTKPSPNYDAGGSQGQRSRLEVRPDPTTVGSWLCDLTDYVGVITVCENWGDRNHAA